MSTNYPGAVDNFGADRTDNTNTKIPASDVNNLRHAVTAIENELGINPKGLDASVDARLDRIDTGTGVSNADKIGGYTPNQAPGVNVVPVAGADGKLATGFIPLSFKGVYQKIRGNALYTDSIPASGYLTKTIPLGGAYKFGQMIINANGLGLVVSFDTNAQNTLICGNLSNGTTYTPTAWSKRLVGYVANGWASRYLSMRMGYGAAGNPNIAIDNIYINGTDLTIVFHNEASGAESALNCNIDWEVWE